MLGSSLIVEDQARNPPIYGDRMNLVMETCMLVTLYIPFSREIGPPIGIKEYNQIMDEI